MTKKLTVIPERCSGCKMCELACAINATTPGLIAREAMALGVPLVHYSTDYVFDGSGSAPRDEAAATAPLSVYGRTKLEGENLIRASGCRHLICAPVGCMRRVAVTLPAPCCAWRPSETR